MKFISSWPLIYIVGASFLGTTTFWVLLLLVACGNDEKYPPEDIPEPDSLEDPQIYTLLEDRIRALEDKSHVRKIR